MRTDGSYYSEPTVNFKCEYIDGTEINTSNSASATCYPRDPRIDWMVVRGMRDLARLYQFHLARVKRAVERRAGVVPPPPIRPLPTADNVKEYMLRDWDESCARHERIGYDRLDREAGVWRSTLKGSFLKTWRLLRPWKQISCALRDRRADRELREAGFGRLEVFRG